MLVCFESQNAQGRLMTKACYATLWHIECMKVALMCMHAHDARLGDKGACLVDDQQVTRWHMYVQDAKICLDLTRQLGPQAASIQQGQCTVAANVWWLGNSLQELRPRFVRHDGPNLTMQPSCQHERLTKMQRTKQFETLHWPQLQRQHGSRKKLARHLMLS